MNDLKPALAKALIQFQFNCPPIKKDQKVKVKLKSGGEYSFEFSSFGEIKQTIKQHMFDAKLGYTFLTLENKFICRLVHETGEYQDTAIDMPKFKEAMQENGSALSHLKRYTLVLALGIDSESDDDANLADGNSAEFQKKPSSKAPVKTVPKEPLPKNKGDYVVKVGKFASKKLSALDPIDIQQYLTWLYNNAREKGQNLSGDWLEFAKIAEEYITPGV